MTNQIRRGAVVSAIANGRFDIDDAVRAGIIRENDIPQHLRKRLGETHGKRIDTLVTAMIEYGQRYLEIGMDEQMHADMMELRQFMFDHVYHGTAAQREEKRAKSMLRSLYEYFIEHPDELPDDYFVLQARGEALERIACDYVAGMTDRFASREHERLTGQRLLALAAWQESPLFDARERAVLALTDEVTLIADKGLTVQTY